MSFAQVSAEVPEPVQRPGEWQPQLRLLILSGPCECCSNVVVLRLQPFEPPPSSCTGELRFGGLSEREENFSMAPMESGRLTVCHQSFGGELANRLQHGEARLCVSRTLLLE